MSKKVLSKVGGWKKDKGDGFIGGVAYRREEWEFKPSAYYGPKLDMTSSLQVRILIFSR